MMLDYALEYEIVDKSCARTFNISSDVIEECEKMKNAHIPYTEEEIQILWDNVDCDNPWIGVLLIQCYMGMATTRNRSDSN